MVKIVKVMLRTFYNRKSKKKKVHFFCPLTQQFLCWKFKLRNKVDKCTRMWATVLTAAGG